MLPLALLASLLSQPLLAQQPAPAAASAAPVDPFQAAVDKLKNEDPMIRRQGAEELGRMRKSEGIEPLVKTLADAHPFVRSMAADSLGLLRAGAAVAPLSRILASDKEAGVRQSAATALAYIGDPSAAKALASSLV
ncbi:MAG: HEAT repeat domain-containing protein, partial [Elusimicrobia bacterium]|nr:HEAT repeat domain-containing protein [Elusimicrobiota bacterium]